MSTVDDNDRLRGNGPPLPDHPLDDAPEMPTEEAAASQAVPDPFGTWGRMPAEWLDPGNPPPPRECLLWREPTPQELEANPHRREFVGVLPRGKVAMIAAAGAVGKTMALCQLAIAVATGGRWLARREGDRWVGGFQARGAGRVLLALAEEDAEEIRRRLFACARGLRLEEADRRRVVARVIALPLAGTSGLALTDEHGAPTAAHAYIRRHLIDDAGENGWALIVLDPASRFAGEGMEVDNALATRFVEVLESLCSVPGRPTVVVAHHTSQGARNAGDTSATAARGVTGFVDGVRWQAVASPPPRFEGPQELIRLCVPKNNYTLRVPERLLVRGPDGVLFEADDDDHAALAAATGPKPKASAAPPPPPATDPVGCLLELAANGRGGITAHLASGRWDWRLDAIRDAERKGRKRPQVLAAVASRTDEAPTWRLGSPSSDADLLASMNATSGHEPDDDDGVGG